MGHLRLTIGYLKATVVHIRVTLGHLRVLQAIFSISKHEANTTELHPKVRQTCLSYRYCGCLILSYGKTCRSYRLNQLHKSIFCSEFEVKLLGNTFRVMIYTKLFVHVVFLVYQVYHAYTKHYLHTAQIMTTNVQILKSFFKCFMNQRKRSVTILVCVSPPARLAASCLMV